MLCPEPRSTLRSVKSPGLRPAADDLPAIQNAVPSSTTIHGVRQLSQIRDSTPPIVLFALTFSPACGIMKERQGHGSLRGIMEVGRGQAPAAPSLSGAGVATLFSFLFFCFRFAGDLRRIFRCLCRAFNPFGQSLRKRVRHSRTHFRFLPFLFLVHSDPCHPQNPKKAPLVGIPDGRKTFSVPEPLISGTVLAYILAIW